MTFSNQYVTLLLNVLSAVAVAAPAVLAPLAQTLPGSYFMWLSAVVVLLNIGLNAWRVQVNALDAAAIAEAPVSEAVKLKAVDRLKSR